MVDDHATVREALRFVFAAARTQHVVEATSSAEAITIVRHEQLDLVLLDVVLRDGKGLWTLAEIKDISPKLPVLIHSFDDNPRLMSSCFHLGAAGYVIKGLDKNLLIRAVRRTARGERIWTSAEMALIRQADADSATPLGRLTLAAQRDRNDSKTNRANRKTNRVIRDCFNASQPSSARR